MRCFYQNQYIAMYVRGYYTEIVKPLALCKLIITYKIALDIKGMRGGALCRVNYSLKWWGLSWWGGGKLIYELISWFLSLS